MGRFGIRIGQIGMLHSQYLVISIRKKGVLIGELEIEMERSRISMGVQWILIGTQKYRRL